ncbi:hypothetical protein GCM10023166_10560 [Paeniglutamicibacter cryotolerans]
MGMVTSLGAAEQLISEDEFFSLAEPIAVDERDTSAISVLLKLSPAGSLSQIVDSLV